MDIDELKNIDAVEIDPFDVKKLRIFAKDFRSLYVMNVESPGNDILIDVYLVGGKMYYIDRNKYKHTGEIMLLADFISEAQPFSIGTLFYIRRCFMWGIKDEVILYPNGKYEFESFNYTAKIICETDTSIITVYGYSNTSDRFAVSKAHEFINQLLSLINSINFESDQGHSLQAGNISTKLLMRIKEFLV